MSRAAKGHAKTPCTERDAGVVKFVGLYRESADWARNGHDSSLVETDSCFIFFRTAENETGLHGVSAPNDLDSGGHRPIESIAELFITQNSVDPPPRDGTVI